MMYLEPNDVISKIIRQTRTIAVVGLSSQKDRAGNYVPAYLQRAGYRIIPVNPHLDRALGERAYPDLASIEAAVDLVLVFRRPEHIPALVEEAIELGVKAVWMQLGIVEQPSAMRAREAGLDVVMDACMMVEHRRLAGRYPTEWVGN